MSSKHQYPGYNLPLRHFPQTDEHHDHFPIGAHTNCWGAQSEPLQMREAAMMLLMDQLTDKPDWSQKVFDDTIVAKWRAEALSQSEDALYRTVTDGQPVDAFPQPRARIISEKCFDYCIEELRSKAHHFDKTSLVVTLDADGNAIVKSGRLVPSQFKQEICTAFEKLRQAKSSNVDWNPRSGDMVQNLVHPSLYPFVYGQSRFLPNEDCGLHDCIDKWMGKADMVLPVADDLSDDATRRNFAYSIGGSEVPPMYWSDTYQWLPANFSFRENGSVECTSYINNLHPKKFPDVYNTIEKLIGVALDAWDQCLGPVSSYKRLGCAARSKKHPRFTRPSYFSDEDDSLWEARDDAILATANVDLEDEDYDRIIDDIYEELGTDPPETPMSEEEIESSTDPKIKNILDNYKWKKIRDPILPEPEDYVAAQYTPRSTLREKFKNSGLQIIVKMASIELTPEKPQFPAGGWHIEGQMNEHICATALYYLDSENVTPSHLSFRMQTSSYQDELQDAVGQDDYSGLSRVYGTSLGPAAPGRTTCVQNYGKVETKEGRLLAFPNTFQHRVSPFELADKTKPGHRRFIALWLVDPHQRIISTANVPPQQLDWWAEATFGSGARPEAGEFPPEVLRLLLESGMSQNFPEETAHALDSRLPPELLEIVREHKLLPDGLMTLEDAKEHRLKLMDVRSRFVEKVHDDYKRNEYNFCEH